MKCVIVLMLQTGQLVERFRAIIFQTGFSIHEFCRLLDKDVYDPISKIAHKVLIPSLSHCLTIKAYKVIIQEDTVFKGHLYGKEYRACLIETILNL